jgi:hypothetical protein
VRADSAHCALSFCRVSRVAFPVGPIRFGRTEIVIVLTSLGLSSAAAIPYYVDVGAAHRRTEVRALAAQVAATAELGNSLWQGSGQGDRIDIAGAAVGIVNGYPAAPDLARLLDAGGAAAFDFENGSWTHRDPSVSRDCGVTYRPPVAPGAEPQVDLHLAGC